MIETAPTEVLTRDELKTMENSEVGEVLSTKTPAKVLNKIQTKYKKDVKSILSAIKNEEELPLPIVIKHANGYYLLGGNTRLSALASIGHTMPVKVLKSKATPMLSTPSTSDANVSKNKKSAKQLFNKLLNMKVTNPETGNLIKVDTAMDYNKKHPAHAAAMNLIRQHMRGLSNRAGIPKNRKK
jgi:hypothetical protein